MSRKVWVFDNNHGYLLDMSQHTPLIRAKTNYAKAKYQHTTLEKQEATPLRVEASRTIHPTNREEE